MYYILHTYLVCFCLLLRVAVHELPENIYTVAKTYTTQPSAIIVTVVALPLEISGP